MRRNRPQDRGHRWYRPDLNIAQDRAYLTEVYEAFGPGGFSVDFEPGHNRRQPIKAAIGEKDVWKRKGIRVPLPAYAKAWLAENKAAINRRDDLDEEKELNRLLRETLAPRPDEFLTPKQTAHFARCHGSKVNWALKTGSIPARKINGQTMILLTDAMRFRDRLGYEARVAERRARAAQ